MTRSRILEFFEKISLSKSQIDRSLIELFIMISLDPKLEKVRKIGLFQREILYIFGSYTPSKRSLKLGTFSYLDDIRDEFQFNGGHTPQFSGKNTRQILDNHLRKLTAMNVLRKNPGIHARYSDGKCIIDSPNKIVVIKNQIKRASQTKCWSSGTVSLFPCETNWGESKLNEDQCLQISDSFKNAIEEMLDKSLLPKIEGKVWSHPYPWIVININDLVRLHPGLRGKEMKDELVEDEAERKRMKDAKKSELEPPLI